MVLQENEATSQGWLEIVCGWLKSQMRKPRDASRLGVYGIIACSLFGWYLWLFPNPGWAITVLGGAAVVVAIRATHTMHPWEEVAWIIVAFFLCGVEMRTLYKDRQDQQQQFVEAQAAQTRSFLAITSGLGKAIEQSQSQFESTMNGLSGVLAGNTAMLARQNKTLGQTMGGDGYPTLMPSPPLTSNDPNSPWTVEVAYFPKDNLPLVDVNLDIRLMPPRGFDPRSQQEPPEVWESTFHPQHITLGTLLPNTITTAPFRINPGKRYYIIISTRRRWFYEKISFDRSSKSPWGWDVPACLYGYKTKRTDVGPGFDTPLWGRCN